MTETTAGAERRTPANPWFWAVTGTAGAATVAAAVATAREPADPLLVLLVAAALAVIVPAPILTQYRADRIALTPEEVLIIPGLLLLPGPALVLAVVIGESVGRTLGYAWSPTSPRRFSFHPRRIVFNVAQNAVAAAAAVAVSSLLPLDASAPGSALAGAVLGGVAYSIVAVTLVAGMVAAVSRRPFIDALTDDAMQFFVLSLVVWSAGTLVGVAVLALPWPAVWIAATVLLVLAGSAASAHVARQGERLEKLLGAASTVHRSVDQREVERAVERSARELLDCHEATLGSSPPADGEFGVELAPGTWLTVAEPRGSYATFDEHDRDLLEGLAALAAPALDHAHWVAALRVADDLKAAVLASISHDLRGPLATATGIAELLIEQDEALAAEERRTLARGVRTAVNRVDRLVSELLDLERYELGRLPEPADADMGAVVAEAAASVAERVDVVVEGDRVRARIDTPALGRVVENLLTNAAKHSRGNAEVVVRYGRRGDHAWLVVEDAGPGVPVERREEIFEPFRHGAQPGSVGLGLWVARRFVDLRDGRIWVDESPAGGAAFHVTLPLA